MFYYYQRERGDDEEDENHQGIRIFYVGILSATVVSA